MRAIIFANGLLTDPEPVRRILSPDDFLIAADGGTQHARALGLTPAVIIGDLDSLSEEEKQWAGQESIRLETFPQDKDETDLELAIQFAVNKGFDPIVIVAALGGRIDQTIGNLSLLTDPQHAGRDIRLDDGVEEVLFTRNSCQVRGMAGDIISLLPWGGEVRGVNTKGLRWVLDGETLSAHKTRGISNEMLAETAQISIRDGLLLVTHRRNSALTLPVSEELMKKRPLLTIIFCFFTVLLNSCAPRDLPNWWS